MEMRKKYPAIILVPFIMLSPGTAMASLIPGTAGTTTIIVENFFGYDDSSLDLDRNYSTSGNHTDSYRGGFAASEAFPLTQYVSAKAAGASHLGVAASAEIDYAVTFFGSPGSTLSVLVKGREGSTGTGAHFDTFESISIGSDSGTTNFYAGQNTGDPTVHQYNQFSQLFSFTANVTYSVSISAAAYGGSGETSSAFADPYFDLTPQQARDFRMVFSPGIGNVASVPLPSSVPLFGAGLIALGAVGYVAKRRKAADTA